MSFIQILLAQIKLYTLLNQHAKTITKFINYKFYNFTHIYYFLLRYFNCKFCLLCLFYFITFISEHYLTIVDLLYSIDPNNFSTAHLNITNIKLHNLKKQITLHIMLLHTFSPFI